MKMIVGLGNPGRKYNKTRHNIGFMVIEDFANKNKIKINKKKFNGLYEIIDFNDEKVLLLKPQAFINLSGQVIRSFMDYYKIDLSNILIISDDMDLSTGILRLKPNGSSGGHNGLKNIEENLHTNEYKRLRIGISNNKDIDSKDYVLGKLSKIELMDIEKTLSITYNILIDFFQIDFEKLMNKYN